MKKRWDNLLEDMQTDRLQKLALRSGSDTDWGNYEQRLVRMGDVTRALNTLVNRVNANPKRTELVRKLKDQVEPQAGKELMATGTLKGKQMTWLVLAVTGNNIRGQSRISTSLLGSRWEPMSRLLPVENIENLTYHVAEMRETDMPTTKDSSAT